MRVSTRDRAPRSSGLQGLGKCDWNNPCSERDKVIYRMEYYTLVWFEHAGTFQGQTIDITQYMIILYNSWLQLMMQEQNQDKTGAIYKKYAIFGDQYFIMFGGSADSKAKEGSTKYYSDARMNGKCYDIMNHAFWFRACPDKKNPNFPYPVCASIDYFVKGGKTLEWFLGQVYAFEVNFYRTRIDCENPPNLWGSMLTLWLDPIGTVSRTLKDLTKNQVLQKAFTDQAALTDLEKQVFAPTRANQEAQYRNEAIAYGGFGLAGLAIGVIVLKAVNKDGKVPWWQWGILGAGSVIAGKKIYEKFTQNSTLFTDAK